MASDFMLTKHSGYIIDIQRKKVGRNDPTLLRSRWNVKFVTNSISPLDSTCHIQMPDNYQDEETQGYAPVNQLQEQAVVTYSIECLGTV